MNRDHYEALADILGPRETATMLRCTSCSWPVDWPEGVDHWDEGEPYCEHCCPNPECSDAFVADQAHTNSARAVEKLYTPTGALVWSARTATIVASVLGALMVAVVAFGAWHGAHRAAPASTAIDPCALVLTPSGQTCR